MGAKRWWTATLVLVVVCTFVRVLGHGFVNWDDGPYIVYNALVTDPSDHGWGARIMTPGLGYPLPLVVWLYGILWQLSGTAWPFHLLSLIVHSFNVVMLAKLVERATKRSDVAWYTAVAFAVHPVVVESVAWATGLKDLLAFAGGLVAVWGIQRGAVATLGGVVIALASKPSTVLIGFALPMFVRVQGAAGRRRRLITCAGAMVLGVAWAVFAVFQERADLRTSADAGFSPARVFGALGLQVEHLLIPSALAPRYPIDSVGLHHLVMGGAVVLVVGWLAWRWRLRDDPILGWLCLGVAFYVPVSNVFPLMRFTADSYLYATWGCTTVVLGLSYWRNEAVLAARIRRTAAVARKLPAVLLAAWALISYLQAGTWASSRTLWEWAAQKNPDDGESIYRYGDALVRDQDLRGALELYLTHLPALESAPRIPWSLANWYAHTGDLDAADHWYGLAFASEVKQDDEIYTGYLRYIADHPKRHRRTHDSALVYALDQTRSGHFEVELSASQQLTLSELARHVGGGQR